MFGRKRRATIRPTDLSAADGAAAGLITEDLLRRIERLSLTIRKPLPGGPAGEHLGRGQGASIEFADHETRAALLHALSARRAAGFESANSLNRVRSELSDAGLAYLALNQLDVVRVYGLGNGMVSRSPRYTGRKQGADVFRLLRNLPTVPSTDLGAAFAAFLADRPARGLVVVLSDLLNASDYRPGLRRVVQAGFEVTLLHVLSEAELNPIPMFL